MIRKLSLLNFMAHAKTELNLSEGLNVIVGPNNIGKSTIALALKILARNSNSSFVMRHEQKECSITVETSDGHLIQWQKKKSPSYVINGEVKDRLGRGGTPPELDETLRLSPVEFEDKDFEPHFGDQKSPIFLINRPPSQIAQFFSTTSDAERLVSIQRLHHKKKSEAQAEVKWLSEDNERIQESLAALTDIPNLQIQLERLEQESIELEAQVQNVQALQKLIVLLAESQFECQAESIRLATLEPLQPVPSLDSTKHLENLVELWEFVDQKHHHWNETHEALRFVQERPACHELEPLELLLSSLEAFILEAEHLKLLTVVQANLPIVPKLVETASMVMLLDAWRKLEVDMEQSDTLFAILGGVEGPVSPVDLSNLISTIQHWQDSEKRNSESMAEWEAASNGLTQLERQASDWLGTNPTCETCGAELTLSAIRRGCHND